MTKLKAVFLCVCFQNADDNFPDILQFAPVNVIRVEDCQDDFSYIDEQHICIRDPTGEQGACFVSSIPTLDLRIRKIFTPNCYRMHYICTIYAIKSPFNERTG